MLGWWGSGVGEGALLRWAKTLLPRVPIVGGLRLFVRRWASDRGPWWDSGLLLGETPRGAAFPLPHLQWAMPSTEHPAPIQKHHTENGPAVGSSQSRSGTTGETTPVGHPWSETAVLWRDPARPCTVAKDIPTVRPGYEDAQAPPHLLVGSVRAQLTYDPVCLHAGVLDRTLRQREAS